MLLGGFIMVAFVNSFLSYLLLMVILLVIFVCGIVIGKELRKSKDKKQEAIVAESKDAK
jgi:hypothetical protein